MPITIQDYMKAVAGREGVYSPHDYARNGVALFGHCEYCAVTLYAHIAYPSVSGTWRCAGCIGDDGFNTVEEFQRSRDGLGINCPCCGEPSNISEIQVINERSGALDYVFECGECGLRWP